MNEMLLKDWTQFVEEVHKLEGEWIFRGVPNESYELQPRIGRSTFPKWIAAFPNPKNFAEPLYSADAEFKMFEEFQRAALPYLDFSPRSDLEWLAVAQHCGLPTRLLDWTQSPYVAAFFVVRDGPKYKEELVYQGVDSLNELRGLAEIAASAKIGTRQKEVINCAVFAVRAPEEVKKDQLNDLFSKAPQREARLFYPPHLNRRVAAQLAVLTLHDSPELQWEPAELHKFRIDGGSSREFREALNLIGINESTMFADLDGLGRHLGWKHMNPKLFRR